MTSHIHSISRITLIMLIGIVTGMAGCHLGGIDNAHLENSRFMDSWATYTHCLSSMNLDIARLDAEKLAQLRKNVPAQRTWNISPAERITGAVLVDRLAVDINAMTASCTLHAGKAAVAEGRTDTAREIFHRVIHEHPTPAYSYYTSQARAQLAQLDLELQASLH